VAFWRTCGGLDACAASWRTSDVAQVGLGAEGEDPFVSFFNAIFYLLIWVDLSILPHQPCMRASHARMGIFAKKLIKCGTSILLPKHKVVIKSIFSLNTVVF
jgi:hypothetical protein